MLLTILGFVLLAIGILYIIFFDSDGWIDLIGFFSLFFGAVLSIVCSIMIIDTQLYKNILYQNMLERKTAIEYRLEQIENNDKNVMTNGGVYEDILEYNKEIRSAKKWAKNPWTSWFYIQEIADLDYIPLPNGS